MKFKDDGGHQTQWVIFQGEDFQILDVPQIACLSRLCH